MNARKVVKVAKDRLKEEMELARRPSQDAYKIPQTQTPPNPAPLILALEAVSKRPSEFQDEKS